MFDGVLHTLQVRELAVEEVDDIGFTSDRRVCGKGQNAVIGVELGDGEIGVEGVHVSVEIREPCYCLSVVLLSRHSLGKRRVLSRRKELLVPILSDHAAKLVMKI